MKNCWKSVLVALTLLVSAWGCGKESVDIDQLTGSWYEVYPENFAADGGVAWVFGVDNTLIYCISDVFAGDNNHYFTYRISNDGRQLTVYSASGDRYEAQFGIDQCSKRRLSLKRLDRNPESDYYSLWHETYTFQK